MSLTNKIINSAAVLMVAVPLVSCSNDIATPLAETSRAIKLHVVAEQVSRAAAAPQDADGIHTAEILKTKGFNLDIVDDVTGKDGNTRNVAFDTENSEWEISPSASFSENQMRFWGYSARSVTAATFSTPAKGVATLDLTYPKTSYQPNGKDDLLFAYSTKTFDGTDQEVSLTFKHAMSKVSFTDVDLAATLPVGYTTESISIVGLQNRGEATFNGGTQTYTWSSVSGSSEYTLEASAINGGYVLVPPQNAKDAGAILQLKLKHATEDPIYLQANMADYLMLPGKEYEYSLKVTSQHHLELTMQVKDWDDAPQNVTLTKYEVSSPMTYDGDASFVDDTQKQIVIVNQRPVVGSFTLAQPLGAHILIAVRGNVSAFEIDNPLPVVDGSAIEVRISPTVDDPKRTYQCQLQVFLVNHDGTTEEITDDVLGTYKDYTIILPSN